MITKLLLKHIHLNQILLFVAFIIFFLAATPILEFLPINVPFSTVLQSSFQLGNFRILSKTEEGGAQHKFHRVRIITMVYIWTEFFQ